MKKTSDVELFLLKCRQVAATHGSHRLHEARGEIVALHEELTRVHRNYPMIRPRPQRRVTGGRDASHTSVVVTQNSKTYHTAMEHSQFLCIQECIEGNMVMKTFNYPVQKITAAVAIMRDKLPCRRCRLQVTDHELALLQQNNGQVHRSTLQLTKALRRIDQTSPSKVHGDPAQEPKCAVSQQIQPKENVARRIRRKARVLGGSE